MGDPGSKNLRAYHLHHEAIAEIQIQSALDLFKSFANHSNASLTKWLSSSFIYSSSPVKLHFHHNYADEPHQGWSTAYADYMFSIYLLKAIVNRTNIITNMTNM